MSYLAIWIDRKNAKLFQISPEEVELQSFHFDQINHHTHAFDEIDYQKQEQQNYSEIVGRLQTAQKILILGPGVAKHHFRNFLLEHHPALGKKIMGCETVDHPSDAQISALAKKYLFAM